VLVEAINDDLGVLEGLGGAGVGGGRLDVLADDDDAQEDQLDVGLRDP